MKICHGAWAEELQWGSRNGNSGLGYKKKEQKKKTKKPYYNTQTIYSTARMRLCGVCIAG
jgi:hypothetical protein